MPQITTVELYYNYPGLPQWLSGKESSCKAGDAGGWGSIPGSGTSPGGGNGNSLQCSCLEKPRQRRKSCRPCKESDTTEAIEHACMVIILLIFTRNCLTVFPCSCTTFRFPLPCMRDLIPLKPLQYLVFKIILVILVGV